jgi:hypothetical protein
MDKDTLEGALKKMGLSSKDIEPSFESATKTLEENGALAERLKVPVVPGIFTIKGDEVQMLQSTGFEQILHAFDDGATTSGN